MTLLISELTHEPALAVPPRLTVRIADATKVLGIGRSKFYELINAREIETIKIGTSTLVIVDSIHALIQRRRDHRAV